MPGLTNEQIDALLTKTQSATGENPWDFALTYRWPTAGAVRIHAKEMRCTQILSNGKECRCSTHYTVAGKIRCHLCAVKELNDMVADYRAQLGIDF